MLDGVDKCKNYLRVRLSRLLVEGFADVAGEFFLDCPWVQGCVHKVQVCRRGAGSLRKHG